MPRLAVRLSPSLRKGLTIVELLVVMVLFGLLGTVILRMLTSQSQFFKDQAKLIDGRRQLRLGASVLPVDLRAISTIGGDVTSMAEDKIVIRAPIGSSVVCARTNNTLTIPPTNLARNILTSWYTQPVAGDELFVYNENLLEGSEDDVWEKFLITAVDKSIACPGAPYTDAVLDPPATKPRFIVTVDISTRPIPDSVKVGAVIRFTRPMRYQLQPQGAAGRSYLTLEEYQAGAWQGAQPIAGPYRPFISGDLSGSGLQFRYFDTTGTRITNMASTAQVSRVDVYLRSDRGNAAFKGRNQAPLRDSVLMRIAVRNAK
jgi:prepilin-type N-terminal cleavage/methylation domain-containing protein